MQTDAIHEDVSTVGTNGSSADQATGAVPVLSDRELAMLEITQQLQEQELAAGFGEPVGSVAAAPDVSVVSGDQLVKVKVDGIEVELPLSDVTKGYQKDAVASKRLADAAAERKKLAEWEVTLKAREAALVSGDPAVSSPPEDRKELLRAYNAAMIEGDEDEQSRIFEQLIGDNGRQQTTQPIIDEEALLAKAEARIENKKAWNDFVGSNPAFADETSKQRQYGDYLFNTTFSSQIEAGAISYQEALNKVAEEVSGVFGQPQTTRQQKEERKARIDNLPVAAGARAVTTQTKPPTTEDVIERMRRERGQPV